jgi:hypothetical protein
MGTFRAQMPLDPRGILPDVPGLTGRHCTVCLVHGPRVVHKISIGLSATDDRSRPIGAIRGPRPSTVGHAGSGHSYRISRHMPVAGLRQCVEQRLGVFEIRRVETFGEPAVDRREKLARFGPAVLVAA